MKKIYEKPLTKAELDKRYREKHKKEVNERQRKYREKNKELYNEKQKNYRDSKKEHFKKLQKQQYPKHKERLKEYRRKNKERIVQYRKEHRQHLNQLAKIRYNKNKDKMREYRNKNKNKINEYNKKWQKKKRREDSLYRTKSIFRSAVYQSFKRLSIDKPTNTPSLLGCSYKEAKAHIERLFLEGMTWKNYGLWHIDHIRPVCSFQEHELHLMNLIQNLQPLWAKDNFKKSSSTTYQSGSS